MTREWSGILLYISAGIALSCAQRIVFPSPDAEFPRDCVPQQGGKGVCLTNCSSQQVCYFLQGEPYYCCPELLSLPIIKKERPAAEACQSVFHTQVVRGIPTQPKEFPYMVALGYEALFSAIQYDYKCGGVLISPRFVLSAAHCMEVNGLQPTVALLGGVDLGNHTEEPQKITKIIIHPEYDVTQVYHDIALIELATAVADDTACLWLQDDIRSKNLTAIGYGQTLFGGSSSSKLLKAYFQPMALAECQRYYEPFESMSLGIIQMQLCANDPEKIRDTCQGDSGGPLLLTGAMPKPYVVGVTSFGQGCALSPPGIYTRVSAYVNWIEGIVWPHN